VCAGMCTRGPPLERGQPTRTRVDILVLQDPPPGSAMYVCGRTVCRGFILMRVAAKAWSAAALIFVASCTSHPSAVAPVTATSSSPAAQRVGTRAEFSPSKARLVGTIHEAKPPADDITLFQPIILDAYKVACPNVLDVQSQLRYTKKGMFVVVRCGDAPARAVRVVYTGVTVPNLVGADDDSFSTLAAMLGLNINELSRRAQADEEPNTIVEQHPAAGTVVPFGTTMTVVIASQPLTELRVKGAFTTSTAASVPGSGLECGMHQSRFIFETYAMRLEGGTEVARVEITLPGFGEGVNERLLLARLDRSSQ
jgi:PASTA domain